MLFFLVILSQSQRMSQYLWGSVSVPLLVSHLLCNNSIVSLCTLSIASLFPLYNVIWLSKDVYQLTSLKYFSYSSIQYTEPEPDNVHTSFNEFSKWMFK